MDFMLGDFSLAVCILGKISAMACFALHMHLEQGNHKDRRLIAINLIGTGEASVGRAGALASLLATIFL